MKLSRRAIETICDIMDHAHPGESLAKLDLVFFPGDSSQSSLTVSDEQMRWASDLAAMGDAEGDEE